MFCSVAMRAKRIPNRNLHRFGYEVKSPTRSAARTSTIIRPGYARYTPTREGFWPRALFIAKEPVAIGFLAFFGNQIVGHFLNKKGMNALFESLACLCVAYDPPFPSST